MVRIVDAARGAELPSGGVLSRERRAPRPVEGTGPGTDTNADTNAERRALRSVEGTGPGTDTNADTLSNTNADQLQQRGHYQSYNHVRPGYHAPKGILDSDTDTGPGPDTFPDTNAADCAPHAGVRHMRRGREARDAVFGHRNSPPIWCSR